MKRDCHSLTQQKGTFKSKSDANALDKLVFTSLSPSENVVVFLQEVMVMFLYVEKHKSKWCYCFFCLFSFGKFFMELCLILNKGLYKFYYLVIKASQ